MSFILLSDLRPYRRSARRHPPPEGSLISFPRILPAILDKIALRVVPTSANDELHTLASLTNPPRAADRMPTLCETWYVIAREFDVICTALRTGSMKFNIGVLRKQKCSVHNPDRSTIGNEGRFTLKPTLAAARNSALRGCKFCKVIARCLECFTKGEYDDSTVHFDSYYQEPSLLKVWLPDQNEGCNVPSITIELHIKGSSHWYKQQLCLLINVSRLSELIQSPNWNLERNSKIS